MRLLLLLKWQKQHVIFLNLFWQKQTQPPPAEAGGLKLVD
jgi:hypothetical protein